MLKEKTGVISVYIKYSKRFRITPFYNIPAFGFQAVLIFTFSLTFKVTTDHQLLHLVNIAFTESTSICFNKFSGAPVTCMRNIATL